MEKILPKPNPPICRGSTSGQADSRVRTFLYLAGKEGLPENAALSFLKSLDCSKARQPKIDPNGLSLREDLRKLDDITAETRLLVRNRIYTAERLFSYQSELKDKITALTADRKQLYKLQRTAAVKADPEKAAEIKDQISALSKELAALRKEVSLCDDIAERSGVIKEKIKAVREVKQNDRKERTDHVQFR